MLGQGEKVGDRVDGVILDSNNWPNVAIKLAVGMHRKSLIGFETCHIWPKTCYDPRYHTAIANLVLLPRALAALSDHDPSVQAALKFRAWELYGWVPTGQAVPTRPTDYPNVWHDPMSFTSHVQASLRRRKNSGRSGGA